MRSLILTALAATLAVSADLPRAELNLQDAGGHKVKLRDLRGKPVVLNFWATWCEPCKAEMPMLVELEKQYAAYGVLFIGASLDEPKTRGRIPTFLAEHRIEFPVWIGANADDLDRLRLGNAVPATAFLDADGHIVARILGQARAGEVKERLEWLTGDRSGSPPEALVKHLQ